METKETEIEIEMTVLKSDYSATWFAYASPWTIRGGEVTSPYRGTAQEALDECLRMARACWGNVVVITEDEK